ncbi:hypothetical protein EJ04DRAFT_468577, partial [Polyplosphaeria fusca]
MNPGPGFESPAGLANNTDNDFNGPGNGRPDFNGPAPGSGRSFGRPDPNDTTAAPVLLGVAGMLLLISMGLLAARLWSRLRPFRRLYWDDWTVIAATLLALVNYILLSVAVVYGLGRHARFVVFQRRRTSLELIFYDQVIWYWSITLVKLSVACLLYRLKRASRRWRIFLLTIMSILLSAVIVQTVFQFTQCRPFSVYWDPRVLFAATPVKCFRRSVINTNIVAFSCVQVGADIVFSLIPIIFIRKLNRPKREKILLAMLMGLGLFASMAAIVRTLYLQQVYNTRDLFRTNVSIVLWASIEQAFGLIAATIPTLRAFLEKSVIRVGMFFYDEKSEVVVRGRLVAFGLLDSE